MKLRLLSFFAIVLGSLLLLGSSNASPTGPIFHLHLTGVINPIKARYVENAMRRARDEGARLVIISINTPGGLVDSTEHIIGQMVNSPVPVVTFVEPQAAMATSAGTFIVGAGDVAAMVPGTTIGSAHPVGGQGEKIDGPMEQKIVNVLVSQSKSLAERRNRNTHFAEQAVKSSMNLTAEAAKDTKVIELLASDFQDLLKKLDGFYISHENRNDTLSTKGAQVVEVPLSRSEEFLDAIANPSVAYILMTLGVMGLIYEFGSPGLGLGAIVGSICLILGLLSLSALPIHLGGILLLLLGIVMLVLELKIQSHGLLTVGGATSIILGAFVLVDAGKYYGAVQEIKFGVVLPLLLTVVGTMFFFIALTARTLGAPQLMGASSLLGERGTAKTDIDPEGMVFVDGALWKAASSSGRIEKGTSVLVKQVLDDPDRLLVEPGTSGNSGSGSDKGV